MLKRRLFKNASLEFAVLFCSVFASFFVYRFEMNAVFCLFD